jgi:hypothetical protein
MNISRTLAAQGVTNIIAMTVMDSVTPNAAAKHDL